MLACTALVGCTSEDGLLDNDTQQGTKSKAYMSLTIGTNSAGRGVTGDSDGDADDSGHHNNGTTEEQNVNSILVVVKGENVNYGVAALYNSDNIQSNFEVTSTTYTKKEAFELGSEGTYKLLVVLNPATGITAKLNGAAIVEDYTQVTGVYNEILNGHYASAETTSTFANDIAAITANGFMMANKEEVSVTLTGEHNKPENAPCPNVNVERVASKITFLPSELTSFPLENKLNVYKVSHTNYTYSSIVEEGWIKVGTAYVYIDNFNQVKDATGQILYKVFDNATYGGAYVKTNEVHTGDITVNSETVTKTNLPIFRAAIADGDTPDYTGQLVVVAGQLVPSTETNPNPATIDWYVQLDGYVLTNLNKQVYWVRHHLTADATEPAPFGIMGTNGAYLADPFTVSKNTDAVTYSTWFYNDYASINENITKGTVTANVFAPLTANAAVNNTTHDPNTLGISLGYCFESAVMAAKQSGEKSTGITFRGKIYDTKGQPVGTIYKYKEGFYKTLDAIIAKYPDEDNIKSLSDANTTDNAVIRAAGIEVYENGTCYYSSLIKHFEYPEGTIAANRHMEYAIMRNNIYVLQISSFSEIGTSYVVPAPGVDQTEKVYLKLMATIKPWIVRFNNIEF